MLLYIFCKDIGLDIHGIAHLQTAKRGNLQRMWNQCHAKFIFQHIDQRQAWVRQLRDASITKAHKVGTNDNLADLFTKALKGASFTTLRDQFMVQLQQQ